MVPDTRSDNDVCSYVGSKLDGKRACPSSSTGNQERFSFLHLQQIVDSLVSGEPVDGKSGGMQGIERGWSWRDKLCRNSHILGIMTNADLIRRADHVGSNVQSRDPGSHLFNDTC